MSNKDKMIAIEEFMPVQIESVRTTNTYGTKGDEVFSLHQINDLYSGKFIETSYETKIQAIEAAFKHNKNATWAIIPVIRFKQEWETDND